MIGNYGDLVRIAKEINKRQNRSIFNCTEKPILCGNNPQSHPQLEPKINLIGDDFELILACKVCQWEQEVSNYMINAAGE
ncbi:hypothetical protein AAGG74_18635 [Bacillus mexicanus]|uniref:hypothetical protein n=1 Tax=Bacillus mexicanus TaxID=2834415 RepID=UPI003D243F0A